MNSYRLHIRRHFLQAVSISRALPSIWAGRFIRSSFCLSRCPWLRTLSAAGHAWLNAALPIRLTLNALLILIFGFLHAADGVVTYWGLHFNLVDEVNPVLNYVAQYMGLGYSIFLMKLFCIEVLFVLYRSRRSMRSLWNTAALAGAVSFYCWVVGNNVFLVAGV